MSYTTGSVNTHNEIVNLLRLAGQAVGWQTLKSADGYWLCSNADGSASFSIGQCVAGSPIWDVPNGGPAIFVSGVRTPTAANDYLDQPGQDYRSAIAGYQNNTAIGKFITNGPFVKYHMFATGQYLHMAIEISAGVFGFIMVGQIDKEGAVYNGGGYNCASLLRQAVNSTDTSGDGLRGAGSFPFSRNGRFRVDNVDNINNGFGVFADRNVNTEGITLGPWCAGVDVATDNQNVYMGHPSVGLILGSANMIGSNTMLVPCTIYWVGAQSRLRHMGSVPDHAVCDMSFLSAGDIITYGSDEWMVFPVYRKGTNVQKSSLTAGVAFKLRR